MRRRGGRNEAVNVGRMLGGDRIAGLDIGAKIREHTAPLVWAEVVGAQVAAATEVLGVENGVLRISARSSVWASELTFYKADILRRLNAKLGATREPVIHDILFQNRGLRKKKTGEADAPPPLVPTPEELDDIELSARELASIEAGIAAVQDESLRARLRRVRIADARLRTWRLDNGWIPCPRCGDLASPFGFAPGDADPDHPASCPRCRLSLTSPR